MHEMAAVDRTTLKLIGGALQHLTEMQQDEDRLELLKEAIDCLPISTGITIIDVHGRIVYVNAVQAEMHGYPRHELLGRDFSSLSPGCPAPRFSPVGVAETFANRECRGVRKDGAEFPVLLSSIPVRNAQGRCIGVVTACEDITGRKDTEKQIEHLAYYDSVTGLPNRTLFIDRLDQALALAHNEERKLALLFLDLDRFKDLNETQGHEFGDQLLREVARRLAGCLPESTTLARIGGDEFVILLRSQLKEEGAAATASRVQESLAAPFRIAGRDVYSSASIGIALYPGDGSDAESLFSCADAAMYDAKRQGRGNYQFFSQEMNRRTVRRVALENGMRQAVARGEFFLNYQPQWDLKTERLSSVEALLRWQSPDFGTVRPDEFIPIAESSGLIHELGQMVLETACRQASSWEESFGGVRVAVNISGRQFSHPDFLNTVAQVIARTGVLPSSLELELTESVIMEKAEKNIDSLMALKKMGVQLAIDDFGTGYSSLSYLKHFPIDVIKIDRSFIAEVETNNDDAAITDAIISMAHSLNLRVVAEGVENSGQLQFLRERRCDGAQGYYLATPMPAAALSELLGEVGPGR
jgi:diguanylate cyclase (GGDEF)-like protein/PAS domain S-box-containing protein